MELTAEVVKDLLDYNPDTGVFCWKHRPRKYFSRDRDYFWWNKRFEGNEVGYVKKPDRGYIRKEMRVFDKGYVTARVIWLWMTGEWPEGFIDHIDRNPCNNIWSNLRDVSQIENSRNASKLKSNTSGRVGVGWIKITSKWQARIMVEGKAISLGHFHKWEDAVKAREEAEVFYGFSKGHGEERPY